MFWIVGAVDGYLSDVATIDGEGNLQALNWGAARFEAVLPFPNNRGQFLQEMRGSFRIEVEPVRSTDSKRCSRAVVSTMRGRCEGGPLGSLAANDLGRIALKGLSTASPEGSLWTTMAF